MADEHVIVVDMGTSSVKVGYSGDDVPNSVFPSSVQKWGPGVDVSNALPQNNKINLYYNLGNRM